VPELDEDGNPKKLPHRGQWSRYDVCMTVVACLRIGRPASAAACAPFARRSGGLAPLHAHLACLSCHRCASVPTSTCGTQPGFVRCFAVLLRRDDCSLSCLCSLLLPSCAELR
jgi:hypothetical protein